MLSSSPDTSQPARPAESWLGDSDLLQVDHPKIRLHGMKLTQLKSDPREKAMACFMYVRDLPYGCMGDSLAVSSVGVMVARCGDGFSKATLFIALLRGLGIPARLRVVLVRALYLRGLGSTGAESVAHPIAEILLDGRWLGVDSYAVDAQLAVNARAKLALERQMAGYGIHRRGDLSWDGRRHSYGQFSVEDPGSLPIANLGVHDDARSFYAALAPTLRNRVSRHRGWSPLTVLANHRIQSLRTGHPSTIDKLAGLCFSTGGPAWPSC